MLRSQRPLTLTELESVLAPLGTPVDHTELSGGTFSAVQLVNLADGRAVVVKTSVPDHNDHNALLTYEHDLLRVEADMLALLGPVDGVPTATLLLEDFTRSHVEVEAIATTFLAGSPWDRTTLSPDAEARASRDVGGVFARLHRLTSPRFGYPARDFALGGDTWPDAFNAIFHAHLADAEKYGVDVRADELRDVLTRGQDALGQVTTACLVHNDLWPGNVLLDPASGRVQGIVDWERALYGDPLMDFVGMAAFNTGPLPEHHVAGYLEAGGILTLDDAADQRIALYRLALATIMLVEVLPRGFEGDWLPEHLATTTRTRDEVLAHAQATFPA
ncbi:phosphotransferase family protein [Demequina sp.]|uniref:phosphotransferase family protein n=1 Tax=Demequina sp. TaxID=2050685 RepID=UPI003D11741D